MNVSPHDMCSKFLIQYDSIHYQLERMTNNVSTCYESGSIVFKVKFKNISLGGMIFTLERFESLIGGSIVTHSFTFALWKTLTRVHHIIHK